MALGLPEPLHHLSHLLRAQVERITPERALLVLHEQAIHAAERIGLDDRVKPAEQPLGEVIDLGDVRIRDGAVLIDGLEAAAANAHPLAITHAEQEVSIE